MYNDGLVNLITKYDTRILSNLESKERSITGKNIKKHRRRSKQNQLSIYLSKLASVLFPATRCPFCFDLIWLRSGYIHRYMRHLLLVLVLLRLWHSVLRCAVLHCCSLSTHCLVHQTAELKAVQIKCCGIMAASSPLAVKTTRQNVSIRVIKYIS